MKVIFSVKAEDQLREIQTAFREVSQKLASRFAQEVRSAVKRLERLWRAPPTPPSLPARIAAAHHSHHLHAFGCRNGSSAVLRAYGTALAYAGGSFVIALAAVVIGMHFGACQR